MHNSNRLSVWCTVSNNRDLRKMKITILSALCCFLPVAYSDVGSGPYLPPDPADGYIYEKPSTPLILPTTTPKPTPPPEDCTPLSKLQHILTPPSYLPPRPCKSEPEPEPHGHHHHKPGNPFEFKYAVNSVEFGNDYSNNAVSDGDQIKGEYRVLLPDGRTQVVTYVADWATGYHPKVRYEGQPRSTVTYRPTTYSDRLRKISTNQINRHYVPY